MLIAALSQTLAQSAAPAAQSGDDKWMVYAIIAFGMAFALLILEAFVPSGGVLGILGGVCAIGGIVMFFMFDDMWGMVAMAVTLLSTPFVLGAMLWIWPNTPIGRALTLERSQKRLNEPGRPSEQDDDAIQVGTQGEALTELRPVGSCRLKGQRMDCISYAGVIEPGTKVQVVQMDGMSIKVKAL